MNRARKTARLLGLLLLLLALPLAARERILDWHSEITVRPDGWIEVTEHIRVNAEHNQIRRGIYRDFPLKRRPGLFEPIKVEFVPVEFLRDGEPETWRLERKPDSVRIWLGRPDRYVSKGEHEYLIRYRTWPQLGHFRDYDELYWNVTGNDWAFPIDRARATVTLPRGIPLDAVHGEAYTGTVGERGKDWKAFVEPGNDGPRVRFETTRPLRLHEGLTIAVSWPKGFVAELIRAQWWQLLRRSHPELPVLGIGLLLLLAYYGIVWYRYGRDLPGGVIHPRYRPPEGHSPASARYLRNMGYDDKTFATAIVSLAVKGYLEIVQETGWSTKWVLRRTGNTVEMAPGEQALVNRLFAGGRGEVALTRNLRSVLKKAREAHEKSLRRDYERRFFVTNRGWALGGIGLSLAVFAMALFSLPAGLLAAGVFALIWLSLWTGGVVAMSIGAWRLWRSRAWFQAFGSTLFLLPFLGGEFFGLFMFSSLLGPFLPLGLILVALLDGLFYHWLKAPTRAGRKLLDEIEGFREYLVTAEADEITAQKQRFEDLGLFERYLPWAMALDVEQAWASHFEGALSRALQQGQRGWHPAWYRGGSFSGSDLSALGTGLGAGLAGALSAATASSSGTGGGGGSGGGGGGGGGGGW